MLTDKSVLIVSVNKAIEFSKDACIKLFTDLPELFATVQEQAERAMAFQKQEEEADTKN